MTKLDDQIISIMIVDDHYMVRVGLRTSIEKNKALQVITQAENGRDAIEKYRELQPDVVLMDLMMPDVDGIEASKQILQLDPNARIIALTSYDDYAHIHSAIEAGVISYLLKDVSMKELVSAIHAAYQGDSVLAQEATQALMRATQEDLPGDNLTPAELGVLKYVSEGLSNAEIARELVISKSTVKKHVSKILRKLDVSNRAEAAVMAVRHKLVELNADV